MWSSPPPEPLAAPAVLVAAVVRRRGALGPASRAAVLPATTRPLAAIGRGRRGTRCSRRRSCASTACRRRSCLPTGRGAAGPRCRSGSPFLAVLRDQVGQVAASSPAAEHLAVDVQRVRIVLPLPGLRVLPAASDREPELRPPCRRTGQRPRVSGLSVSRPISITLFSVAMLRPPSGPARLREVK